MSTRLQTHAKAASTPPPTFTPVRSRLLQRNCARGGTPLHGEGTEPFDMPLEQLTLIGLGSRLHSAMGLGEISPKDVAAIVALWR